MRAMERIEPSNNRGQVAMFNHQKSEGKNHNIKWQVGNAAGLWGRLKEYSMPMGQNRWVADKDTAQFVLLRMSRLDGKT